ncbi:MAG: rod shape-determining protein MreD [Ruminococcus sp.]|nr:rod shape-determining protein MreD [Ruminococcus sp.]
MERRYTFFLYAAYSLELLLLFILQTTPLLIPELFGGKPLLMIPAVVTVSLMEEQVPALFFGLAGGALLDLGCSDNLGYYTITLTLICFLLGFIFRDYMVVSFLNAMGFTSAVTLVTVFFYFIFFILLSGRADFSYFVSHCLSRILYTIVCTVPLYFINKFLFRNLRDF